MHIWTIKEGEPLPIDECPGRQMRSGIVSEMLVKRGHDVTWWTSDFFHQTKVRLRNEETVERLGDHYRLHMLHANTVYTKNISVSRIRYSRELGKSFRESADKEQTPDLIFCAYPLIDFAYEAVRYGKEKDVPVIVDVRDLWPDIIWEKFGQPLGSLVKLACKGLRKKTEYILKNATAVIGVIPKCLQLSEAYGRSLSGNDRVYGLAYAEKCYTTEETHKAKEFWKNLGILETDTVLCWIGQISEARTDFRLVLDVVIKHPDIKMVVCGDGPSKQELAARYQSYKNIVFPGFLDQLYLDSLMKMASIGVIPIHDTPDFTDTLNNKVIEYMAGELCIATTLSGQQKRVVEKEGMGFFFQTSDEFEEKLLKHLNDNKLITQCQRNARAYFEKNYKSETVYGALCSQIEEMGKHGFVQPDLNE